MNLRKLRIVVDEREKKSGIPDLLKGIGISLEIKMLPVGDYIVAPDTVVERKTISDLVSSIFDGRLFDQCNRLKKHYQFPILLIEGDIDEIEELTENPLIYYGAISSIAIDFKIPVMTNGIKNVVIWKYYCPGCKTNFSKVSECPRCGNKLKRKPLKN